MSYTTTGHCAILRDVILEDGERGRTLRRRPQVLVVDDDPGIRAVLSRLLDLAGFSVLTAIDGVQGVALFREHADTVDAVLLDAAMPRMDGPSALKELRRERPGVPVVVCSAFGPAEIAHRFRGKGAHRHIQKPFHPDDLFRALRDAIKDGSRGARPHRSDRRGASHHGAGPGIGEAER